MRRTIPAVSFHSSSINLMIKNSRPLLAADMNSIQRARASWNELPFWFVGKPKMDQFDWHNRTIWELGLRRIQQLTKTRWIAKNLGWSCALLAFLDWGHIVLTLPASGGVWINRHSREHGVEWAKKNFGAEVWCADGKFVRPHYHMTPPMFTMTVEEL
eukprot:PhF_6_TR2613/c1_g1_i1/m.4411